VFDYPGFLKRTRNGCHARSPDTKHLSQKFLGELLFLGGKQRYRPHGRVEAEPRSQKIVKIGKESEAIEGSRPDSNREIWPTGLTSTVLQDAGPSPAQHEQHVRRGLPLGLVPVHALSGEA
jgi:hypothetical protein